MKLPRTNIGHPGSPPSKGGISGAGGYIMPKRPSFKEYYATKKRPLKEDDKEEKEGMSNAAKTAAALGISVAALLAMSPTARTKAMELGKKAIGLKDTTSTTVGGKFEPMINVDVPPDHPDFGKIIKKNIKTFIDPKTGEQVYPDGTRVPALPDGK